MIQFEVGYLFKKKYVIYEEKEYEIFEFLDYVAGIHFTNTEGKERCNILTGNYSGIYADILNNKNKNEGEYVFVINSLEEDIKSCNYKVDFDLIRKSNVSNTRKYYIRSLNSNHQVFLLRNEGLLTFLQNEDEKGKSGFNEEELEKNSDISSMYTSIKKTIVAQDEQIMQILTALFKNQRIVNSNLDTDLIAKLKENVLIYGSTGTGKTEILKRISKLYNIPIVIEDATSLSETGYVGRKITDMLEDLCLAAGNNIDIAEKGILVIDEFDKLAEKSGDGQSHVSRLGVQRSLLKLLDGTLFYFDNKKFDTSKLTIVALGAFTGITDGDDYSNVKEDDFIKYGVMRELMARFPKHVAMSPLSKDDLIRILIESNFSPLNTYRLLFEYLNMSYSYSDDYVEYIADRAIETQSGARSLKNIVDEEIGSAMFRVFAGEYSSIRLVKPEKESGRSYILKK